MILVAKTKEVSGLALFHHWKPLFQDTCWIWCVLASGGCGFAWLLVFGFGFTWFLALAVLAFMQISNGKWRKTKGNWRTTNRKWMQTSRKWRKTNRKWRKTIKKWRKTNGTWKKTNRKPKNKKKPKNNKKQILKKSSPLAFCVAWIGHYWILLDEFHVDIRDGVTCFIDSTS